ncbi:hypothetical protein GPECTOR_58g543 [Gonium pectorale]|uniref:Uncharacterized protein n=1 Tax=Gonium pectorale TaxID=33097 RepID=A0A150G5J8_GONPE|nr:hypothetical protein GPECTOR_58g543 [Gonium pectorale]|eukprot:KXZ45094.1 hypothetical protein GPECTOR_58g543 [Gonium pectorale]
MPMRLLLGGTVAGASMLPEAGSAIAASLHSLRTAELLNMQEMGLLGWFLVDLGINWAGWAVAAALKTEMFYDALGTSSFLALTAGSLITGGASGARKWLVSGMVGVWAVRLGSYLVSRIHQTGRDRRFDSIKNSPGKFFVAWTMQAVWVWVTLLPVLFINGAKAATPLRALDAIGIALFALGFGIEVVADWQKAAFRARPDSAGRFIDEGLWSYSRHPNYFGEMVLWWGVFATCAPGFSAPWQYAAVASPLLVAWLLTSVSGVPLLEKSAEERWGSTPEYREYKARTHVLLPLPRLKDTHTS